MIASARTLALGRLVAAAAALTAALCVIVLTPAAATSQAPPVVDGPRPGWPSAEPQAAAWVLVEAVNGQVLAGEAVDDRRPVASTVKVLTVLTAVRRSHLDELVTVGDEVVAAGGAGVGLAAGDVWRVRELVEAAVARSGNDAALALAAHVAGSPEAFVALMAEDARRLGLGGVVLTDPTGLDDGNRLSARDLATIARAALAHDELRPLLARPTVDLPGIGPVASRNELLASYPGATGVKTGYTYAAGYGLVASARRDGRELIAVVLDAGPDPARFEAAEAVLDLGFERYAPTGLEGTLALAVGGGHLDLEVAPLSVTVPVGSRAALAFQVPVRPPSAGVTVPIVVDGRTVGRATAEPGAPPPARGGTTADLGRAAVDGVYAALRAAAGAGVLR